MAYTFSTLPNGNIQTSLNGQVVGTGTASYAASQYGYQPTAPASTPAVSSGTSGSAIGIYPTSTYVPPPVPPTTISSETTSGSTGTTNFQSTQTPAVPATPVLSTTVPQITLTPLQQSIQDLVNSTMADNTTEAGKADYQNQQNQAQDITGKTQLVNDLTSQFNNLTRQAQDIPNQLQLQSQGRGITAGGLAPIQADQLRLNSIASNTLASQIETAKGNLTYAQSLADNAVAAKFDPIEASIKAKMANLQLLANSPQATVDEKNQAAQTTTALKAQQDQVAEQKQTMSDNLNLANQAIQGGLTDSKVIAAIQNAPTTQQAQILAAPYLTSNASKVLGSASTGYFTYNPSTGISTPIGANSSGSSPVTTASSGYKAGQLTTLLQSQGKTADNATLQSLWQQYGDGTPYNNDTAHNSIIYSKLGGQVASNSTANGILVAGIPVDPNIANDVTAVLEGRNTLYNIRQTMGRTNAAAAYMQNMRNTISSIDPTFDFVASDAGGKFVSSTFYQKAATAITSVLPNIDEAINLSNQVSRVGVVGVDSLLQKAAVQIGDQQVSNFREAQKLIADEIGLALGQGTVSDMKLQLGFDVTDPALKPEVFASNLGIVKDFLANRLAALKGQRYSSSTVSGSNQSSNSGQTVTSNGQQYIVGQVYNDGTANWTVDAQGNWTKQ